MLCAPSIPIVGGVPAAGDDSGWDAIRVVRFTTVDVQTPSEVVAQLPVVGASIFYQARGFSVEVAPTPAANGVWQFEEGMAARNAAGSGIRSLLDGSDGWTPPGAPWATVAIPWAIDIMTLVGNNLTVAVTGTAGFTINWVIRVAMLFTAGATP